MSRTQQAFAGVTQGTVNSINSASTKERQEEKQTKRNCKTQLKQRDANAVSALSFKPMLLPP